MQEYLTIFAEHFVPIIATIFGAILTMLASSLVRKFGSKLDVDSKARLDDLVSSLTQQGVAYAEQWAKNRKDAAIATGSNEKLHTAMEYVADEVKRYKLDELAENELVKKIEAMLGFGTLNELQMQITDTLQHPEGENDENWS